MMIASRLETLMALATGYDLVAELVLWGPRGERLAQLRGVTELGPLLTGRSEDDLLADHYDLFGRGVQPFANIFHHAEGLAGGEAARALADVYARIGFKPPVDAPGDDHLGVILLALTHAVLTEVEYLRHGLSTPAAAARAATDELLDRHLVPWLLPLVEAVSHEPFPFYQKLLVTLMDLIETHRKDRKIDGAAVTDAPSDGMTGEDFDLRAIAQFFVVPARSGLLVTKRRIHQLAVDAEVPTGFGTDRVETLSEVLKTAARFDRGVTILERMAAVARDAVAFHESQRSLAAAAAPWRAKAEATARLMARLATEARAVAP